MSFIRLRKYSTCRRGYLYGFGYTMLMISVHWKLQCYVNAFVCITPKVVLFCCAKKNNPLANTWKLKALAFYWTSMGASPLTVVKPWEFHLSTQLFTAVLALLLLDLMLKFWCLHQKIQTYESMQYLTAFVRGFHTSSDLMVQLTQVIERFSVVIKVQISLVCMNK